jgi:hypothetical protein
LENGNEDTAKKLLEKGADVNLEGGDYGRPLTVAVAGENEGLVCLLLGNDVDVTSHGPIYKPPLTIAAAVEILTLIRLRQLQS